MSEIDRDTISVVKQWVDNHTNPDAPNPKLILGEVQITPRQFLNELEIGNPEANKLCAKLYSQWCDGMIASMKGDSKEEKITRENIYLERWNTQYKRYARRLRAINSVFLFIVISLILAISYQISSGHKIFSSTRNIEASCILTFVILSVVVLVYAKLVMPIVDGWFKGLFGSQNPISAYVSGTKAKLTDTYCFTKKHLEHFAKEDLDVILEVWNKHKRFSAKSYAEIKRIEFSYASRFRLLVNGIIDYGDVQGFDAYLIVGAVGKYAYLLKE